MNNCIGIINLDENEQKTTELTRCRPLASPPIIALLITTLSPILASVIITESLITVFLPI